MKDRGIWGFLTAVDTTAGSADAVAEVVLAPRMVPPNKHPHESQSQKGAAPDSWPSSALQPQHPTTWRVRWTSSMQSVHQDTLRLAFVGSHADVPEASRVRR